jgi:hypothetical protein
MEEQNDEYNYTLSALPVFYVLSLRLTCPWCNDCEGAKHPFSADQVGKLHATQAPERSTLNVKEAATRLLSQLDDTALLEVLTPFASRIGRARCAKLNEIKKEKSLS